MENRNTEGTRNMEAVEDILQSVKKYLPAPGTELGCYKFLAPDALWTGEANGMPFVVVAEDRWPFDGGGFLIAVTAKGAVDILDLDSKETVDHCAAGFPQFMEIMKLYQELRENTPYPDVDDEEGFRVCEEAERTFRQQVMKIDPSAIEDTESLWSTMIEELGSGM